jgi:hypothetical protein
MNMTSANFRPLVLIALLILAYACGSGSQPESDKTTTSAASETAPPAPAPYDPDPTDTIPGDAYPVYSADTTIAALIRASLQAAEKDMLTGVPPEQRKFKYHAIDLNKDGQHEYLVALYTPPYCGTGGCSAYLFNTDGSLHSRFTVVDFPVYVASSLTDGWSDLIMYSGRENRLVKLKGRKYPANPSVQPAYKGTMPDKSSAVLQIFEGGAYPAFSF